MTTGTAGTTARKYPSSQVHYVQKAFTYADTGTKVSLGYVPKGARVIRGGVVVETAFDGDSANTCDLGTAADQNAYGTVLALGTVGVIAADEMATCASASTALTADTEIVAYPIATASATAGAATAWVEYIVPQGC